MAYIGRVPNVGNYFTLDAITTSSTATYNLLKGGVAYVPETAYHLFVSLNGVIQAPITAYTVSGSTIVFASSLSGTDSIDFITVLGDTLAIGTPSDDTVATASLKANAVTDAKIADVAATKLTGSIADARVPASAVTQHVTGYDDSAIRADISALALREATNETSAAFNLPNSFIDTFTDDTNLGTQTTCDRVTGYMETKGSTTVDAVNDQTTFADASGNNSSITRSGAIWKNTVSGALGGSVAMYFGGDRSNSYVNIPHAVNSFIHEIGSQSFTVEMFHYSPATSDHNAYFGFSDGSVQKIQIASDTSSTIKSWASSDGSNWDVLSGQVIDGGYPANTWEHIAIVRDGSDWAFYSNGSRASTRTTSTAMEDVGSDFRIAAQGNIPHAMTGYIDQFRVSNVARYDVSSASITVPSGSVGYTMDSNTKLLVGSKTITTAINATGTLIQSANTVGSAKTEVSGTMLYKDNAGTATLGTDLKIYFTCNGGTNWTEAASYNAITPVYATGIKQVRLGKTTCTSGTDIRYKAVWANQASSSKETQLHGISTNY